VRTQRAAAALAVLLLGLAAHAAPDPPASPAPEATIGGTQNYRLRSKHVDQEFSIDVSAPAGAKGPLPVVYVLDGNGFFGMAAQIVGPMVFGGELPPMIVVGVGYRVASPYDVVALRVRDLTPTFVAEFGERMAARGMPLPPGVKPGGADAFLAFIDRELKPFIGSRYAVQPNDQTLVGDSFGGLFAMHVAFASPRSFQRIVAGSPSLSWDDDRLFRDEAAFAARTRELRVKLFLSAGALETEDAMRANVERMSRILMERGYSGLELTTHIFPDETHHSVIAATISRGLRAVFGVLPD
jgi:predicted alpha/beta superfamily hydrolase